MTQPIDEFNRPTKVDYQAAQVPPSDDEVETLFAAWRETCPPSEVSARRSGLPGGVAVASGRAEDHRDGHVGHRRLASRSGRVGEAACPFRQGQPGPGTQEPLGAWIARWTTCWSGGWPMSATSSATTGPTRGAVVAQRTSRPPHRPLHPGRPRSAAGRLGRSVGRWLPAWKGRLTRRAAPFLRLVAVCPRRRPQSHPGAVGARVAVDHDRLHPRPRRPHRAGLGASQRTGRRPAGPKGGLMPCDGTCG